MTKKEFILKCNKIAGSVNDGEELDTNINGLSVNVINEDNQFNIRVWKKGEEDDLDYFGIDYDKADAAYDLILKK